jgi:uncharacterized heparinase superfamily protein
MQRLTLNEHAQVARLIVDRQRKLVASRLRRSPLMRWKYAQPQADDLLISPQDLRGADPSFASEIAVGHFGLSGTIAKLRGQSPFEVPPPSDAWERELHSFDWLRHLDAAADPRATKAAQDLLADWLQRQGPSHPVAGLPDVASRRLIAWIGHAALLLDGATDDHYNDTLDSLGNQVIDLLASWPDTNDGYPRLQALTALLSAALCIAGFDHLQPEIEAAMIAALDRQVDSDGSHISRDPNVVIDLLLDLLPLRQCYSARDRMPPTALDRAIERMLHMLQFMRLGDGSVARFNGMAAGRPEAVATVLAYAVGIVAQTAVLSQARMARLQRSGLVVIADVGSPPPLEVSDRAHAGCLSFELSDGDYPLLVNCGAPNTAHRSAWAAKARATASHNTLSLAGQSSAKLMRDYRLEESRGAAPLCLPDHVTFALTDMAGGAVTLNASHNGYVERTGIVHHRRLTLDVAGNKLDGFDRLGPPSGQLRLPADLPFAIHFHFAPNVTVMNGEVVGTADVKLDDGSPQGRRWRFAVADAELTIEDSTHIALAGGPCQAQQIVLRGATFGETSVLWSMRRLP